MGELASAFRFQGDDDLRFLRDELYEGSWQIMLDDLQARLELKPSVHKISANIREDIAAIERIMAAEGVSPAGSAETDGSTAASEDAETSVAGGASSSAAKGKRAKGSGTSKKSGSRSEA